MVDAQFSHSNLTLTPLHQIHGNHSERANKLRKPSENLIQRPWYWRGLKYVPAHSTHKSSLTPFHQIHGNPSKLFLVVQIWRSIWQLLLSTGKYLWEDRPGKSQKRKKEEGKERKKAKKTVQLIIRQWAGGGWEVSSTYLAPPPSLHCNAF